MKLRYRPGGQCPRGSLGCDPRFSSVGICLLLNAAAHDRLDGVVFENLPWQDVLARYDGPQALFYLDPPY
ncbi:hypothetical protein [Rhodovulum sp. MB263]|uniref:hypothetical protein n=1 Tax=Rhodovulum sp. (strain MB263) TaxID=308754 RepID=UPI0009B72EC3|nr:hypothetical protein [Rhodovulum sp. MB263]ARC88662.1 hypothetical protein B5V46_08545 [Rhodovulum sp. MB263]